MSDDRITVRLGHEFADRLDAIAALRGLKGRSEAVRSCIEEASADVERRDPPSRRELLCIAGEKARAGNTSAIRLLLEFDDPDPDEPNDVISRLAARRQERLERVRRRASGLSDSADPGERNRDSGVSAQPARGFSTRPLGAQRRRETKMADPFNEIRVTLEALEEEQRERFRPKEEEKSQTPQEQQRASAQAYLDRLNASCSQSISIDAGWLR